MSHGPSGPGEGTDQVQLTRGGDPLGGHLLGVAGEDQHRAAVDDLVLHHLQLPEANARLAQRRPDLQVIKIRPGDVGDHAVDVAIAGIAE